MTKKVKIITKHMLATYPGCWHASYISLNIIWILHTLSHLG